MRQLCAWGGLPCDCDKFPWLVNGLVPDKCEAQMPDALLGIRKIGEKGKRRYKAYLTELEERLKNEKGNKKDK